MKELFVMVGLGLIIFSAYDLFGPVATLVLGCALVIEAFKIKTGKQP